MLHFLIFLVLPTPSSTSSRGAARVFWLTHTVAQDCVLCILYFILVLCVMHFQLGTPPPRRTVGSATSPVRVRFPLSSSRAPPATLAVRGRVLALVSLIIAPAFSFGRRSSSRRSPLSDLVIRGRVLGVVFLIIAPVFSFNYFSSRFFWLYSLAVQRCGSGF